MAISDEVLLQFMQQTTAVVTASATKIESMEKRLFGNGQPGIIEKLYEHGERLASEHAAKMEATAQVVAKMQATRKTEKKAAAVVCSVLGAEGAFIGWLIQHYAALANAAKEILTLHGGH
jgi:hypothetical protein